MKEKIKDFLLHFLIIYVVFIVVGGVIQLITYPEEIKLNDSEENKEKYTELKREAELILDDNECHNTIKEMINNYEKTSFNGKININKYFYDENFVPYVGFALSLKDNCNNYQAKINEENINGKIVANALIFERIFNGSKIFSYEISIKDIFAREIYGTGIEAAEYDMERKLELEIIKELLEIVKEDKING